MCRGRRTMDKKTTGIISYITIVGWLVAYFAGDKEGAKFHLNQSLVLIIGQFIVGILQAIPYIKYVGSVLGLFLTVCWVLGLIAACKDEEKEVPLIGQIKILK